MFRWSCTDGRLFHLFGGRKDFLRAISQAVDLLGFGRTAVVFIECLIDAAQRGLERDAGVFPGLDQRPIERGEKERRAPALLKALFDLGEVVEVVFQESQYPVPSTQYLVKSKRKVPQLAALARDDERQGGS